MKKYTVYFSQINQTMYEIEADSRSEALGKAREEWQEDWGFPYCNSILEEQGIKTE